VLVSARAGIVVTGTEVLTGIIRDANGPWLSERLREQGVDAAHIMVVGDRSDDLRAALEFLAAQAVDLIVTSGGLGPTADDLTAEVVAGFAGRPMVLDEALEDRIRVILDRLSAHWRNLDEAAVRAGNRKQAIVPEGATILEPVGTAPGLAVPPAAGGRPTVLVLPGPPGELQPMWRTALDTPALQAALSGATAYERGLMRIFGIPESEIARTLLDIEADGVPLSRLEITTCLRRGEIEIATLYEAAAEDDYRRFADAVRARHGATLYSDDGTTVDEQVAALLSGPPVQTIATAESCTGGLLAARLTEQPGSSAYVIGGAVVYANEVKTALAGVPPELIERHGAVSAEVAAALADGARGRFGTDVGVGVTGIAGPGGGSESKPVGTVYVSVSHADGRSLDRRVQLPGSRTSIRERTTTVAMHLLRRLLRGELGQES
jgi:nicotinamide-nucleotide amidase